MILYGNYTLAITPLEANAWLRNMRTEMFRNTRNLNGLKLFELDDYSRVQPFGLSLVARNRMTVGVGFKAPDSSRCWIYPEIKDDGSTEYKLFIDGEPSIVENLGFTYNSQTKAMTYRRSPKVWTILK